MQPAWKTLQRDCGIIISSSIPIYQRKKSLLAVFFCNVATHVCTLMCVLCCFLQKKNTNLGDFFTQRRLEFGQIGRDTFNLRGRQKAHFDQWSVLSFFFFFFSSYFTLSGFVCILFRGFVCVGVVVESIMQFVPLFSPCFTAELFLWQKRPIIFVSFLFFLFFFLLSTYIVYL